MSPIHTSFESHGRAAEIARRNAELGGFLDCFASASPETQQIILSEIARMKKRLDDPEALLEEVKGLAATYGAVADSVPEGTDKKVQAERLTARIADMLAAAEEADRTGERAA